MKDNGKPAAPRTCPVCGGKVEGRRTKVCCGPKCAHKMWCINHRDIRRAYDKKHRQKPDVIERRRKAKKKWAAEHREEESKRWLAWYQAHREDELKRKKNRSMTESYRERARRYRRAHREERNAYKRAHRKKNLKQDLERKRQQRLIENQSRFASQLLALQLALQEKVTCQP